MFVGKFQNFAGIAARFLVDKEATLNGMAQST
jgi:hypothetical protein